MDTSLSELQAWTGRSETWRDQIGATPVKALNATLDHPAMPADPGTPLPPLWHWLYFLPLHRQSEISPDGHAKRGGFLPPVPLPRRMWAGSQFEFRSPIRVGDLVERTSIIADVSAKEGRTGKLVFVKVQHELRCNGSSEPAIVDQLNKALNQVLADKEIVKRMEEHGADVETSTPDQLGALVKSELAKWKGVVQRAKLTAE